MFLFFSFHDSSFHGFIFLSIGLICRTKRTKDSKSKCTFPTVTRSKRNTKKMQWTESQMLAVLDAVLNKHLSGNKATALHGVPPSTLKDRLSEHVMHG